MSFPSPSKPEIIGQHATEISNLYKHRFKCYFLPISYIMGRIGFEYPKQEIKMDYIKIRFGDDIDSLSSQFEKTIEQMFRAAGPMFILSERTWKPQMDIIETPEEIVILAEVAGVTKENLEIEINRKAVKIMGKRQDPPRLENSTYRLAEIQYGQFERILFLPALIDTDKVTASYLNGLLQIRLVKLPRDVAHKIPISEG
jgi:HSP20 family protein